MSLVQMIIVSKNLNRYFSTAKRLNKLITVTNQSDFEAKVLKSSNPVIVNFHAEWCEPCQMLTPKLKQLFENNSKIDLVVLNVEHHKDLVRTFEVQAVPAVIAFQNGTIVDKFIGLVDAKALEQLTTKLDQSKKN